MKKTIILLISIAAGNLYANQEEYFLQGNKYYQEHKFKEALDAYQKIEHEGPAVLFNRGNCYFNSGDECRAIASWLQADRQGSWNLHKKVDQNCELAYKKLGKEYSQNNRQVLWRWCIRALNVLPLLWWQLLFLCAWIFSIIGMVRSAFRRQWWRIAVLLIFVCGIMICFVIRYKSTACAYALITEKEAAMRTGPSDDYGMVATAQCLDEVDIIEKQADWLKVHNKVLSGWIRANNVAIIDDKL